MNSNKIDFLIDEETKNTKIVIKKKEIIKDLEGKLSDKDIELAKNLMNENTDIKNLFIDLITGDKCKTCEEVNKEYLTSCCSNKSMPFGNINASIMFVKRFPTLVESSSLMSHSDSSGYFLALMLNKMGYSMSEFYFTDFIKCPDNKITVDSCWLCANNFFLKEIQHVKPKLMVIQGVSLLKILGNEHIFNNIPNNIEYGTIYDTDLFGLPFKVMCIYDIDMVFSVDNEKLREAKNVLWKHLNKAIHSIE